MKNFKPKLCLALVNLCLFICPGLQSQDLEQIGKAPVLTGNGGISLSQIAQYSPDSLSNINAYSYYLSGNLNLNVLGIVNVPLSFAYTNNQSTASLVNPFNRFSLSPSYKWIQTHMGYSSMSFSPYTLAGHEFLGAGVELTPGDHFRVSAMYGRFRKAVRPDSLTHDASYRRLGGALLLGYKNNKLDVTVNLLKARDDINSLQFAEQDSFYIAPEDNLAGSLAVKLKLTENMVFDTEYGISAVNRNIGGSDLKSRMPFLIKEGDLAVYHAFRARVSQSWPVGQIGASYERIAPNYNTFGAYYYTNDFENITIDMASSILKWLHWTANAGYQRDNLKNQKSNTNQRAIFSLNTSSKISPKVVLGLHFTNVQSYVHIKDIYNKVTETNEFQNLDTLNFTQLNLSAGANINYAFKSDKIQRQNFNFGMSYQEASEQQSNDDRYVGNRILNTMLAYQYSLIPQRLNISSSVNLNQNQLPDKRMNVMSYSLSLQKAFGSNLKTAFISTYSNAYSQDGKLSDVVNVRFNTGYKLKKRHSFNLSLAMVSNNSRSRKSRMYSANLNYNYIFNFFADHKKMKTRFEGHF